MQKKAQAVKDAENFVRRAIAHVSDGRPSEKAIREAAMKVAKAIPTVAPEKRTKATA